MWPVRLLLAAFSGFTLALAFPSYDLPFFAWFSVAGLMLVSIGVGWSRAGLCGFFHGMAFYIASLPWIYTVMRVHGGVPHLPAAGILLLLAAVFSLYSAVFAAAVAWRAKSSLARACLAAPFLWVALEFARTYLIFGGFPWNLLGYAASGNLGLLQVVSLTGIYGLSFIVAGYNALLAWLVLAPAAGRLRYLIVWLGSSTALIGVMVFGPRFVPGSPGKSANATQEPIARLVQTDFPQSPSYPADWMERHAAELNDLEELSLSGEHDKLGVIIWPEVPAPFSFLDAGFTARVERIARTSQRSFLVGVVDWKPGAHGGLAPYNGATLLDPEGRSVFQYDKIHLVPFGEYVPLRKWLTFAEKLTVEVGDFQAGSEYKVGEARGGPSVGRFGVFICYEAIFPSQVRRFVLNGANLLVNLSNDGWFGRSAAPAQHLMMARVRAVENRRWLLRGTNNGFTVSIDPYGHYVARLAPDVRAALDAPYGLRNDLTFYTRWGDWLAWVCVVMAVGTVLDAAARRRRDTAARGRRRSSDRETRDSMT